jgi:probable HAF family extracellular repeat protein
MRQHLLCITLFSLAIAAAPAVAQLHSLDMGSFTTQAYAINDRGQIVGVRMDISDTAFHGFLVSGPTISSIDYTATLGAEAFGINNFTQIVGTYPGNSGANHGFLYQGGVFTNIDYPGAFTTTPNGINDSGSVVGQYSATQYGQVHAYKEVGGVFTTIDPPGATFAQAFGINNSGLIVGIFDGGSCTALWCSFSFDGVNYNTIVVPGATLTSVQGVSNDGVIVGGYDDSLGFGHGFIDNGGVFTTFDIAGSNNVVISGRNKNGVIAGRYLLPGGSHEAAFYQKF